MRSSVFVALVAVAACSKSTDQAKPAADPARKPTPGFTAAFTDCGRGLGAIDSHPREAFETCAPLVGDGACRAAWDASTQRGDLVTVLTSLIKACAGQYCPAITGAKPRACTTASSTWAGHEIPVWSELHAAILSALFSDVLNVPQAYVDRAAALPDEPSADELREVTGMLQHVDPAEPRVDGRAGVFSVTAKLLAATFFAPAAELTRQAPIR